jgi:hypothetical protein
MKRSILHWSTCRCDESWFRKLGLNWEPGGKLFVYLRTYSVGFDVRLRMTGK